MTVQKRRGKKGLGNNCGVKTHLHLEGLLRKCEVKTCIAQFESVEG